MAHPISTTYLKKIACRLQSAVRYSSKVNKNIHTPCINSNTENPEKLLNLTNTQIPIITLKTESINL
jgi:hypothetical protein